MSTNIPARLRVDSWIKASPLGFLGGLAGSLADFVFPPYCAACRRRLPDGRREPICEACWAEAVRWPENGCQRCGAALEPGKCPRLCQGCSVEGWACADARSIGPFRGTVAEAVHLLKYSDRRSTARRLAGMMAEAAGSDGRYRGADLVLAVPLHDVRRRERGYNQAQLLADDVAGHMGLATDERAVSRRKHNPTQTKLGRRQRLENVRDIFWVRDPARVRGRRVILVDDVLTTGATIGSCGQAILEAGAAEVLALTAAAAPLD